MNETKEPPVEGSLRQAQAYAAVQNQYAGWLDCLTWLLDRDYISPQVCQEAREAGKKELG